MGGMGLIFTLVLVRRLIVSFGFSGPMISSSWTLSYSKQVDITVEYLKTGCCKYYTLFMVQYYSVKQKHTLTGPDSQY